MGSLQFGRELPLLFYFRATGLLEKQIISIILQARRTLLGLGFLRWRPLIRNEYMGKRIQNLRGQVNLELRKKYWIPLEAKHKTGAWEVLDAGYTEAHRAYHSWEHISDLFEKLSAFSDLSTRADIIAMSAFWHDVVYRTQNHDGSLRPDHENVRDSAELFRQFTLLNHADAGAVYDLIMATANHLQAQASKQYYAGFSGDLDLFLDLDLSSLASPWEEFVEDFNAIRSEFSWVPEAGFYSKQIQILENFAKDDAQLYRRAETREKWRDIARANLMRCVTELKKRITGLSSV
jgi:predicted metal-dependent HD superfamily phosphohydrolase